MTTVTWEKQGGIEQVVFDVDDDDAPRVFACVVEGGVVICDEKHAPAAQRGYDALMLIRARASDLDPFRVTVRAVGRGTAVALYGSVSRASAKCVDLEEDPELAIVLDAALALAAS